MPSSGGRDLPVDWIPRVPPLILESERLGRSPLSYYRYDLKLGWILFCVPLRLLPYRGAARVMVGTMFASTRPLEAGDVLDLKMRTVDGEPSWIFAVPADLMPKVADGIRKAKQR